MEDRSGKPEAPTVQPVPCHATEGLTQQASIAVGTERIRAQICETLVFEDGYVGHS